MSKGLLCSGDAFPAMMASPIALRRMLFSISPILKTSGETLKAYRGPSKALNLDHDAWAGVELD